MVRCELCGRISADISAALRVCGACIKERFDDAKPYIESAHARIRKQHGLPPEPPREPSGKKCNGCGNACRIPLGGRGFCGLVENVDGKLVRRFGTSELGLLNLYYDLIPTNCVPAEFCAGSGGSGYPKWCRTPKGDVGYKNLAVFIGSCTYNCLFCQNFVFHELATNKKSAVTPNEIAEAANEDTACVCYFGGDPSSQMPFVISSAKLVHERADREKRVLRVCLETNLNMNSEDLKQIGRISMKSGGGIKADLKCWSTEILYALSGMKHRQAYKNFEWLSKQHEERPEVPFARASTLLVPGYVDEEEIRSLASFIADLNPSIPYSLLAFHPSYHMQDMPYTRREEAELFLEICKKEGLQRVRIGNPWLLW